ncbi:MAG: formate dehydrogenase subunit gamma [Proteobacteria bacterium]|jgi:formate dehydrogenase subunit gamma|nr:formate dehydrogenase subunit gamma [Pseudomonadota bacterium]
MRKLFIQRYTDNQRINHWMVVVCFGLAGFSGLALFHPSMFFLTNLFGGPQWTRVLHPYLGIAVFVLFLLMFLAFWRVNTWKREDSQWVEKAPKLVFEGDESQMPPVGKYNAGQKLVFWSMTLSLIVLLCTGVLFWQAWFANSVPIPVQRVAVVLHALAAFIMSLTAVVHIYAAIWVKGTLRAMTQGTVSAGWAKRHHLLWYRDKMEGQARVPDQRAG